MRALADRRGSGHEDEKSAFGALARTWLRPLNPCRGAASEKNDPALTYFRAMHYHRPRLLDCRVRKGNGYFQPGMGTGSCLVNELGVGSAGKAGRKAQGVGGFDGSRRSLSGNEVKPIDWLVPVG